MFKMKEKKSRLYNFRITEEEMKMINFLRKSNIDIPKSFRDYIKKIYKNVKDESIDNNIYKL